MAQAEIALKIEAERPGKKVLYDLVSDMTFFYIILHELKWQSCKCFLTD